MYAVRHRKARKGLQKREKCWAWLQNNWNWWQQQHLRTIWWRLWSISSKICKLLKNARKQLRHNFKIREEKMGDTLSYIIAFDRWNSRWFISTLHGTGATTIYDNFSRYLYLTKSQKLHKFKNLTYYFLKSKFLEFKLYGN